MRQKIGPIFTLDFRFIRTYNAGNVSWYFKICGFGEENKFWDRLWGNVDERSERARAREIANVSLAVYVAGLQRAAQNGDGIPQEWQKKNKEKLEDQSAQRKKRLRPAVKEFTSVCRCLFVYVLVCCSADVLWKNHSSHSWLLLVQWLPPWNAERHTCLVDINTYDNWSNL